MKILYIIKDISAFGGREKILTDKMNILNQLGYEVSVINYHLKYPENLNRLSSDIGIYNLNFEHKIDGNIVEKIFQNLITNFFEKKKLKKLFKNKFETIKPDVIINLLEFGFEEILNIKNINSKKILEIHGSYEHFKDIEKLNYLKKIKKYFEYKNLMKNIKRFDKVIILSEIDRNKWNLENIEVIPNFYLKNDEAIIQKKFQEKRFISAGRLSYEKGYDILIEVWNEVVKINRDIKIDIFGEGVERERILKMIKENNLENNILIYPFTNELNKKYKSYYGYVLPSRFEAFGMVILESMSNGVPALAFDLQSGVNDLLTNEVEGFLVEKYNLKKMAQKIILLYNDENLRGEMAINALKKSENFSSEKIILKWINLFEN